MCHTFFERTNGHTVAQGSDSTSSSSGSSSKVLVPVALPMEAPVQASLILTDHCHLTSDGECPIFLDKPSVHPK